MSFLRRNDDVRVETSLRVIDSTPTAPVRTTLRYDRTDPFAVHVDFHASSAGGETVSWTFARELLAAGLDEPTGFGDVRVWPCAAPRGSMVALALSAPEGSALFEVPRSVLVGFLERTYRLIPFGRESEFLAEGLDVAVNRILNGRR